MLMLRRVAYADNGAPSRDTIVLVDTRTTGGNDEWINSRLPTCCACVTADADFAIDCRCTAPSLCVACAPKVQACPQCRQPNASYTTGEVDNRGGSVGCRARPKSNIYAIEPSSSEARHFSFFFKGLKDESRQAMVCGAWNVRTLRAVASRSLGYSAERMIYNGRQLDDQAVVDGYGLQRDGTIHVIMRLCGD